MRIMQETIPRVQNVVMYFPNCKGDSDERILEFVGVKNEGFIFNDWSIIKMVSLIDIQTVQTLYAYMWYRTVNLMLGGSFCNVEALCKTVKL